MGYRLAVVVVTASQRNCWWVRKVFVEALKLCEQVTVAGFPRYIDCSRSLIRTPSSEWRRGLKSALDIDIISIGHLSVGTKH
jgi:hypothetical protein